MSTNDGGPAFPLQHVVADAHDAAFNLGHPGMTLRDYFAAMAMVGYIASGRSRLAEWAYQQADAMLKAREAKP